tara:strand:- start:137 stop:427 length:291 start_codon:yes stop_codon:yes gene_type:complete
MILKQISEITVEDFDSFNEASLSFLIIATSGYNGNIVRIESRKILFLLAEWIKKENKNIINIDKINECLNYIISNKCEIHNREMLINYLNSFPEIS